MIRTFMALAALGMASPALALEPTPAPAQIDSVISGTDVLPQLAETPALVNPAPLNDEPAALASEDLDALSGQGTEVNILTDQDLTAVNSGNTINAGVITNGSINFSQGALNGYSGVGNFVSNTGNNNNLQGSISITVVNTADLP